MNILKVLSAGGVLALSVGAANAATYYATDVIASDPGFCDTTRDGGACSKPSRYNPDNAKGAPDGRFYSLGLTTYNDDGSVDDFAFGSSPTTVTTPPCGAVPANAP